MSIKAKVYKVEIMCLDVGEHIAEEDIKYYLENQKYFCANILKFQSADAGEWHDDHPLNKKDKREAEMDRLFPK